MQQTGLSELAKKCFNFKIIHGSSGNKPSTGSSTKGECVASKTDKSRNASRKDARGKMGPTSDAVGNSALLPIVVRFHCSTTILGK